MMGDIVSFIQDLCMIGWGAVRSAMILGIPQVHSQRCNYDLAHRIAAIAGPSLDFL